VSLEPSSLIKSFEQRGLALSFATTLEVCGAEWFFFEAFPVDRGLSCKTFRAHSLLLEGAALLTTSESIVFLLLDLVCTPVDPTGDSAGDFEGVVSNDPSR